ncbi:MAG: secretion system protein F [Agathobacter sp.]|nr:secretion system protein F [Agathobacter sp.]
MEKKKIKQMVLLGILLVVLAFYMEKTDKVLDDGYKLNRKLPGEGDQDVSLILSPDDMDDIDYTVTVKEEILSQEKTIELIEKAKKEIDKSFCSNGEELNHVTEKVNPKGSYAGGLVDAEWVFSDYEIMDSKGNLIKDKLSDEGKIVSAEVELSCNETKELYEFSFVVYAKSKNRTEKLISKVNEEIEKQLSRSGTNVLSLPKEIEGTKLSWKQPKQHLPLKIFALEVIMAVLYVFSKKENEKKERLRIQAQMELDYSDVVSKMAILMGSGMSVKQAWNRISARYLDERAKNCKAQRAIYEQMVITMREINDGENEIKAYQKFGEITGLSCYHRFSRILVSSLQKGNKEICQTLEQEAQEAFENRRMLARKLGEEAGTKMLLPLMLMMVIVIAIVIAPAIVSFGT